MRRFGALYFGRPEHFGRLAGDRDADARRLGRIFAVLGGDRAGKPMPLVGRFNNVFPRARARNRRSVPEPLEREVSGVRPFTFVAREPGANFDAFFWLHRWRAEQCGRSPRTLGNRETFASGARAFVPDVVRR